MSNRINWKKLFKRIPPSVKIGKRTYEIVWVDEFMGVPKLGETRFDKPQIALLIKQTPKQAVSTYLHEVLHAVSFEENVNLTENQVLALEKSLLYVLKTDNLFKE